MLPGNFKPVYVQCYSSLRYAAEPRGFIWQGEKLSISGIDKEWIEPEGRHFRVRTSGDSLFELVYNEQKDLWVAKQLAD